MGTSNIEWTQETWQVTSGCTKVSPGCKNCYAETMANRLAGMARKEVAAGRDPGRKGSYLKVVTDGGAWNNKIELLPSNLTIPLKRKKPTTYFVNSMSDLFHADVSFEFIAAVYGVMDACECTWRKTADEPRGHTFQVLTKRPKRAVEFYEWVSRESAKWAPIGPRWSREASLCYRLAIAKLPLEQSSQLSLASGRWPLRNVWLGTSTENQQTADERIPHLLRCPAAVRFLSVEPLLGAADLLRVDAAGFGGHSGHKVDCIRKGYWSKEWGFTNHSDMHDKFGPLHWVIVGGESGPGARPCDINWIRSIVQQCRVAGVPVFVKQLGKVPHGGTIADWEQNKGIIKDSKGGDMSEWPSDLRVRQMPVQP
jgi:protein gp37